MTGHWFFDLLTILFLVLLLILYWPGVYERIKAKRLQLREKHEREIVEVERFRQNMTPAQAEKLMLRYAEKGQKFSVLLELAREENQKK